MSRRKTVSAGKVVLRSRIYLSPQAFYEIKKQTLEQNRRNEGDLVAFYLEKFFRKSK